MLKLFYNDSESNSKFLIRIETNITDLERWFVDYSWNIFGRSTHKIHKGTDFFRVDELVGDGKTKVHIYKIENIDESEITLNIKINNIEIKDGKFIITGLSLYEHDDKIKDLIINDNSLELLKKSDIKVKLDLDIYNKLK